MQDPTNPNDNWQDVPHVNADPASAVPPASAGYPPPNYPPPQAGYQPPPNYPPPGPPLGSVQADGLSPSAAAAISYLTFIPAVIFLLIDPYKRMPLVRFHAIQSIALNVVGFAIAIVFAVLLVPMYVMGMGLIIHLLHGLIDLLLFVAWLMAIIKASQGQWFKLPVIGDFAIKQSGQ